MSVWFPPLISSGMVLQREARVCLWGRADEPVTVQFRGENHHATPDANGRWQVFFDTLTPGGPFIMRINDHLLRDVYVGDVWVCAGQSNMQLPMRRVRHRYPEVMSTSTPRIRQFIVPQRYDFHAPQEDIEGGSWVGVSPETIEEFSAAGFFFAKRLQHEYGVPIGLLLTAIGGTPVHCWMDRPSLAAFPKLEPLADRFGDDGYVAKTQAENAAHAQAFFDSIDSTDPGLTEGWEKAGYDDSGWEAQPLLQPWTGTGSVWLRKTLTLPKALAGKPATLFLGTLVDWDKVYVNGALVGQTTYRYPPRDYAIPALPEGKCVIAIRAICKDGGGFTPGKPYHLATEAGSIWLDGEWKFRKGGTAAKPVDDINVQNQPTGLYNGMIAPLLRYAIRGVIWYQGESDTASPAQYAEKFAAMVGAWRKGWGWEFPFIFTELAHWEGGPDWDTLRHEQHQSLALPGTAMAAAFDLGEHNDLHPQGKRAIGERLARCAMRVSYGEWLPASPFEIVGMEIE